MRVRDKILEILSETYQTHQAQLVKASGFSKSRVSEVLSKLEKDGLITRSKIGRNSLIQLRTVPKKSRKQIKIGFTRAAEYPYLVPLRKLLRQSSLNVEFLIRQNGIDVMMDLLFSRIDVAIAPLLTQFIFYTIGAPLKILAPAGSGGSSLISSKISDAEGTLVTTKLSTMELLARLCLNNCLFYSKKIFYADSPETMIEMIKRGKVNATCIWEPYATQLENQGYKRQLRYSEIGEHLCCVISVRSDIEEGKVDFLKSKILASVETFEKNPYLYIEPYSVLTGYEGKVISRCIREYTYPNSIDTCKLERQLTQAGLSVPEPSSILQWS